MSPGSGRRPRAERALLAVAVGAAVAAFLTAYLPVRGFMWVPAVAVAGILPSVWIQWARPPARLASALARAVAPLVATAVLAVILSRLIPALRLEVAELVELVAGGTLSILAAVFLYGQARWPTPSALIPTAAGLLVAAALNRHAAGFLPLAALAGTGLWIHAIMSGGPRRLGPALGFFVVAGGGLAAATIWFLPWAQPLVTRFVARAYTDGKTGLSDRSELGEVERLAPSRRVVARVWTARPQLLRMQVFTYFDGRRWSTGRQEQRVLTPLDAGRASSAVVGPLLREVPGSPFEVGVPGDGAVAETKILPDLSFDDGWGLLVPARPVLLVWPGQKLAIDDLGRVTPDGGIPRLYGVANREPARALKEPTAADLTLPPSLDSRVRDLAERLRQGARSDRALVGQTMDHLRSSAYRYTLDVGRFQGKDPLAEFLFDKKAGYCEYFASAAVVLLRLQGVPARYVKGVAVHDENRIAGHYLVRESDAHAWAEVYLAEEGWVEEDPTPAGGYASTHEASPPGFMAEGFETLNAHWHEALARFQLQTWPRLTSAVGRAVRRAWEETRHNAIAISGAVAAALGLVFGLRAFRRRSRRPQASAARTRTLVPTDLRTALSRVEKHWARCGRPRPPALGLREHLDAIPESVLSANARRASARVVEVYYETAFGGRVPSGEELAEVLRAARSLA